jgi:hypothetical protein
MSALCQKRTFHLHSSEGTMAIAEHPNGMDGLAKLTSVVEFCVRARPFCLPIVA